MNLKKNRNTDLTRTGAARIRLIGIFAIFLFAFIASASPVSAAPAHENNPAPSGDILFMHAVAMGTDRSFAEYKISDLSYTVQKGDVLEFDLRIGEYSARLMGGLDILFSDDTTLQNSGLTDQLGLSVKGETIMNIAAENWMHRAIALDSIAGKTTAHWNVVERGNSAGDYFVAMDNIVITNNGKVQAIIYKDGPPSAGARGQRVAYSSCNLKVIKSDALESELAKYLTPELLLGSKDAQGWIKNWPDADKSMEIVKRAEQAIDIKSCRESQKDKCDASIRSAFAILKPVSDITKSYELDYIGHGHIDMNWLWLWPETVQVIHDTFSSVFKLMDEVPDFKYSQSQASVYVAMEEKYPEIFNEIKKRVDEGRWELTGGSWVEGDLNMAAGESIVRSILYSKRYFKANFGKEIEVLWEPDTFGHAWTIPQIMKKSGLKYYFFVRCGKDKPLFWWEAPDGSRVLAFNSYTYGESIQSTNALYLGEIEKKTGLKNGAIVYGVGDHGGGPTRADLQTALQLRKTPLFPTAKFSFFKEFMDRIEPQAAKLPVIRDELNFTFRGCYTTHADVKNANRKSENNMNLSESVSSVAALRGRPYNTKGFEKAWRNIAFNQFHDIFDGSAIHDSYIYSHHLYKQSFDIANAETEGSLAFLAERVKVDRKNGVPVLVFNQLSWERSEPVEATVVFPKNPVAVIVIDGKIESSAQILDVKQTKNGAETRVLFIAKGVPAVGYKTFYLKSVAKSAKSGVSVGKNFIENKFFRIEIDPAKGVITRILDKANSKEVIAAGAEANVLQMLFEKPTGMSAWDVGEIASTTDLNGDADVSVTEQGPIRGGIRISRKFSRSEFTQNIVMYDSEPRIDFPCKVLWHEVGDPAKGSYMLKVKFPVAVADGKAAFEIPFGSIERPANGDEVPALKWIDVSNTGYGVSLLNDGKYGHDVKDNVMRLSLLRSSYSPDPLPDYGSQEFMYSLYPHKGDWKTAGTVRQGFDLNDFLASFAITKTLPKADLPPTYSFITVQPASLLVSGIKMSEDSGEQLIVRFYDSQGKAGKGSISFNAPVGNLVETDLLERVISPSRFHKNGDRYDFDFGVNDIITLRVDLK